MNITINPGAATQDAAQIDAIVQQIADCMETLDAAMKRNIPEGIQTTWSEQVKSSWDTYYSADIPDTMAEMRQSATNLRMAVEAALKYSGQ